MTVVQDPEEARSVGVGLPFGGAFVAIGLLTVVAAALRFYGIGQQSIWHDEAYSVALAARPVSDIITSVGGDHLPFYFILLKGWTALFGDGEVAVRMLSLVFGVAAVPVVYLLARRLLDRSQALVAVVLTVVSPFMVYYSQETRMYTLVALQAMLSTYFLLRAMDGGRKGWWVAFLAVNATLVYTHYYGLLFLVAQAVFYLLWTVLVARPVRWRTAILPWLVSQIALVILYLPWALQRAGVFGDFIAADASTTTLDFILWRTIVAVSLGHSVEALSPNVADPNYLADQALAQGLSLVFLVLAAIGGLALILRDSGGKLISDAAAQLNGKRRALTLILTVLIGTLLLVFLVSLGKRGFTPRHVIMLAPFFYMLVAAGLVFLRRRARWLLAPAVVFVGLCTVFSLNNYYNVPRYSRDDFRSALAYVNDRAQPDQVIVSDAPYAIDAVGYYAQDAAALVSLPAEYPPDRGNTEARLAKLVEEHGYVWLVLWQDYYADPEQYAEKWLDGHALVSEQATFRGGIRVKGYYSQPPVVPDEAIPNARDEKLGSALALAGYEFTEPKAGGEWRVTLYWRVLEKMEQDYTVFVHLVDPAGEKWAQTDAQPLGGSYPTSRWMPGQVVKVEQALDVPAFLPPIDYHLEIGMYDLQTLTRLPSEAGDKLTVAPVRFASGPVNLPSGVTECDIEFGDQLRLRGYRIGDAERGGGLSVLTYWEASSAMSTDYTVFAQLLDATGALRAQKDAPPTGGVYPTSVWRPGQVILDRRSIPLGSDFSDVPYTLIVGVYDAKTGTRLETKPNFWSKAVAQFEVAKVRIQ